ncbi:TetR/AcrR family transcriptional regulator [Streptomyces tricolor]|nr:TetR/AcrR family transcriptional regulator [Streptomyces tricolor]
MRADARRNYERLLKVAAEAFAEHGKNASLDDIARRAGVGSGTLYRHFPTRRALLEAAYVGRIDALGAARRLAGEGAAARRGAHGVAVRAGGRHPPGAGDEGPAQLGGDGRRRLRRR